MLITGYGIGNLFVSGEAIVICFVKKREKTPINP
jgi:hypothetical protein